MPISVRTRQKSRAGLPLALAAATLRCLTSEPFYVMFWRDFRTNAASDGRRGAWVTLSSDGLGFVRAKYWRVTNAKNRERAGHEESVFSGVSAICSDCTIAVGSLWK